MHGGCLLTQSSCAPQPLQAWDEISVPERSLGFLGTRERFFPQRMLDTEQEWSQPQGYQSSRNVWTTLSGMDRVGLLGCLCRDRGWTDDP